MVVQMAGVVAQLVHERRDLLGESVVLLQVDHERRPRALSDLGEGLGIPLAVDRHADQPGPRRVERLRLSRGRLEVAGGRCTHALHHNGCTAADLDGPGDNSSRGVAGMRADGGRHARQGSTRQAGDQTESRPQT